MQNHKRFYFVSFAEGAAVMAAEICSAKLLAPYFGSSLYVWSSVMAITLGGLASGYFLGGKLSQNNNKQQLLINVLVFAVISLLSMLLISQFFNFFAINFSLFTAIIISTFLLIYPTMLLMGAASPLIISILSQDDNQSGKHSGTVYAISTLGGIIATFLSGFYLIPELGIQITIIVFVILLLISILAISKKIVPKSLSIIFIAFLILLSYSFKLHQAQYYLYVKEGVLGKIQVLDELSEINENQIIRKLSVNNIIQTEMNVSTKESVSDYIHLFNQNEKYFPKGKALILGLGGGLLANKLYNDGYAVTGVELDERIIKVAKDYFYLNSNVKTVVDDARHYINFCDEKYNLVFFDVFKAEEQPAHVLTIESLTALKQKLDTGAIIIINTHGYLTGKLGLGTQCLLATLKKTGFNVKVCTKSENEDYRNLQIIASLKPFNNTYNNELYPIIIANSELVNTDNKPIIEKLNASANSLWRKNYLQNYILNSPVR